MKLIIFPCLAVLLIGCGDDASSSNSAMTSNTQIMAPECSKSLDCDGLDDWCFEGSCVADCLGRFQCEAGQVCADVMDPFSACQDAGMLDDWPVRFRNVGVRYDIIDQPEVLFALENVGDKTIDGIEVWITAFNEFGEPATAFGDNAQGFSESTDIPTNTTSPRLAATMTGFNTAAKFVMHFERVVFKGSGEQLFCATKSYDVVVNVD